MAVLASAGSASALIKDCTGTATNEGGNWFCGAVDHILYSGIKGAGSYQAVTKMTESGECLRESRAYSGPLAPLDQDLSLHFRGPLELEEVAVYYPSSSKKRDVAETSSHVHARRHGHAHFHSERKAKRDMVVATIDGQVVSWENNYFGGAAAPTDAPAPVAAAAVEDAPAAAAPTEDSKPSEASKPKTSNGPVSKLKNKISNAGSAGGDWSRVAYYNANDGVADNLVFLGNYGGEGSGVFDTTWGNSLSYLNSQGTGGCAKPEVLKPGRLPSNKEFSIWSNEPCDESCGYARAQDVAYKGFTGANKVFLFSFKMPMDGDRKFNGDMPAIWALNGEISRAAQYSKCSCWTSGCGEADFIEVLASGDDKCKSTLHLTNGGGSSDYFKRPTDEFVRYAVVFDEKSASMSVRELPSGTDFAEGFDSNTVNSWVEGGKEDLFSLFQMG